MASLLPFLIIIVAFYLLLILPQQRRQKQTREMQNSVSVGTKVVLTSGFLGEITDVADDHISVKLGDGVVVQVVRAAIGQVRPDVTDELDEPADDELDAADDEQAVQETPEETAKRLEMDNPEGNK